MGSKIARPFKVSQYFPRFESNLKTGDGITVTSPYGLQYHYDVLKGGTYDEAVVRLFIPLMRCEPPTKP